MTLSNEKITRLNPSRGLLKLIEANAPFWGAEAEVIRSYWNSPIRTIETDRKWLTHQVYKEYWNGVRPYLDLFNEQLPQAAGHEQRNKLMKLSEIVHEEVEHFVMFADLFQQLDGNDYAMTPDELRAAGEWAENDALVELRRHHLAESPEIGQRAMSFSEGGYCALFTEGKKLAGRGGFEDALAEVCRRIYDDEFNHMLLGIIETDSEQLTDEDWNTLERFTTAQMRQRVEMRNAQFSHPVSTERMQDLLAGKAQAIVFDFSYAERLLNKQAA
jgi:hypothetical protein